MPDITESLDDARAKLVSEIKTTAEADALRKLLPAVRLIMLAATWEQIDKINAEYDRQGEGVVSSAGDYCSMCDCQHCTATRAASA